MHRAVFICTDINGRPLRTPHTCDICTHFSDVDAGINERTGLLEAKIAIRCVHKQWIRQKVIRENGVRAAVFNSSRIPIHDIVSYRVLRAALNENRITAAIAVARVVVNLIFRRGDVDSTNIGIVALIICPGSESFTEQNKKGPAEKRGRCFEKSICYNPHKNQN